MRRVNQVDPKACNFLPDCSYTLEDHTESSLPCKPQILCLVRNVAPYCINQNELLILQIILHSSIFPSCVSNFFCDMLYLLNVLYQHEFFVGNHLIDRQPFDECTNLYKFE